jgi:SAM-dependent methyltransferase
MRANGSNPGSRKPQPTTDSVAVQPGSGATQSTTDPHAHDAAAARGLPSLVWRFGQDRRFAMIRDLVELDGAHALDLGCGVGMYTERMAADGATAIGLEIEWSRAVEARERGLDIVAAVGERLPVGDESLDVVLLHEVLEHVADDRETIKEAMRALRPGGRVLIFVPNRWWPFETHGIQWRGRYHFGNKPFVNYLPDVLRNRLAPHVRVYTGHGLRALFDGLPGHVVHHTRIYPGFDKLATRRPRLAGALRRVLYGFERSPLRVFGLSHLLVVERDVQVGGADPHA